MGLPTITKALIAGKLESYAEMCMDLPSIIAIIHRN